MDYPLSPASVCSANLLTHFKRTVPHCYLTVDVVLESLLTLYTRLNIHTDGEITLGDLLLKTTVYAMQAYQDADGSWQGESVQRYVTVDIKYVMGNEEGMVVTITASVESRELGSISK